MDNRFRASFLSIFDNSFKLTFIVSLVILTNLAIITKKLNEFNLSINVNVAIILFLCLFLIILFVYYFMSWQIKRYEINEKSIVMYKNIFVRDRKEILINNIANICISENIFERIFKLKRIRIFEYAKDKMFCDFEVVVCDKIYCKYILNILKRNNITYSKKFKFSEILKHSFLSIPISSIVVIVNFILLVFNMINDGSFAKEIMYDFLGLMVTLIGFVFPVIYNTSKNVIKYFSYKISKDDTKIYISYGIFTRKEYIIPTNKINGIIVDVSLLSKIFRCYKVNIINAGIGDKKSEIAMLFPICNLKKSRKIFKKCFSDYNLKIDKKRQPYETLVVISAKIMILMLILVIPAIYLNIQIAMYISFFLLALIVLIYLIKRIMITDKHISIINGIFVKRIIVIKYNQIENLEIKQGIISKRFNLYKVYLSITADIKNRTLSTGYITQQDLTHLLELVL